MMSEAILIGIGATIIGMVYYFVDTIRRKLIAVHQMAEAFHRDAMQHRSRTIKLSYIGPDACNYAPLDWPASPITIADCQEIPQYRPTREYRNDGFPGSWLARHKKTGEVIRVIGWRSGYKHRLSDDAIIKDTFERVHNPRDFERLYQLGDWRGFEIIDVDATEANIPFRAEWSDHASDETLFRLTPTFVPAKIESGSVVRAKFPPAETLRRWFSDECHMMATDDANRVICGRCGALMDDWKSKLETCEELRARLSNGEIIRHKLPHIFE